MNKKVRANMVIAMDRIATSLNDEALLGAWLMCGVADGDIDNNTTWEEVDDDYTEDKNFADLMALFMRVMRYALADSEFDVEDRENGNGLLYVDNIVSKRG